MFLPDLWLFCAKIPKQTLNWCFRWTEHIDVRGDTIQLTWQELNNVLFTSRLEE